MNCNYASTHCDMKNDLKTLELLYTTEKPNIDIIETLEVF